MGNWRTVYIEGTCDPQDVPLLAQALTLDEDYENFHCLIDTLALSCIPNWAGELIQAVGNLAERDYSVEDIRQELQRLVQIAPSLNILVHCGDERESTQCISTLVVNRGTVLKTDPQIITIPDITFDQMKSQMNKQRQKNI